MTPLPNNTWKVPQPKFAILNNNFYIMIWSLTHHTNEDSSSTNSKVVGQFFNLENNSPLHKNPFIIHQTHNNLLTHETVSVSTLFDSHNNVLPTFIIAWESFLLHTPDNTYHPFSISSPHRKHSREGVYAQIYDYEMINDHNVKVTPYFHEVRVNERKNENIERTPTTVSLYGCDCFLVLWSAWERVGKHNVFHNIMGKIYANENGLPQTASFNIHTPSSKLEYQQKAAAIRVNDDTRHYTGLWMVAYTVYDGDVTGNSGIYGSVLDEHGHVMIKETVLDGEHDLYLYDEHFGEAQNARYLHDFSDVQLLTDNFVLTIWRARKENGKYLTYPQINGTVHFIDMKTKKIRGLKVNGTKEWNSRAVTLSIPPRVEVTGIKKLTNQTESGFTATAVLCYGTEALLEKTEIVCDVFEIQVFSQLMRVNVIPKKTSVVGSTQNGKSLAIQTMKRFNENSRGKAKNESVPAFGVMAWIDKQEKWAGNAGYSDNGNVLNVRSFRLTETQKSVGKKNVGPVSDGNENLSDRTGADHSTSAVLVVIVLLLTFMLCIASIKYHLHCQITKKFKSVYSSTNPFSDCAPSSSDNFDAKEAIEMKEIKKAGKNKSFMKNLRVSLQKSLDKKKRFIRRKRINCRKVSHEQIGNLDSDDDGGFEIHEIITRSNSSDEEKTERREKRRHSSITVSKSTDRNGMNVYTLSNETPEAPDLGLQNKLDEEDEMETCRLSSEENDDSLSELEEETDVRIVFDEKEHKRERRGGVTIANGLDFEGSKMTPPVCYNDSEELNNLQVFRHVN